MRKLSYILLIILIAACTKFGKNVTIKGRAVNPATDEGIAGVTFSLQKGTGGWNGGYKTIKTATSDENGNFELSALSVAAEQIMANPGNRYGVGWFEQGSDKQIGGNYTMQIKIGKTLHADYHAVPYGYLKLSVHNVNCTGEDKITLDMQPDYLDDYSAIQPLVKDDCYNNDFIESKVPSGNWNATWKVTKSGVTTNHDTTFFIPENGHYHLTINY